MAFFLSFFPSLIYYHCICKRNDWGTLCADFLQSVHWDYEQFKSSLSYLKLTVVVGAERKSICHGSRQPFILQLFFMTAKKGQIYKTLANEEMSEIILSTNNNNSSVAALLIDQLEVLFYCHCGKFSLETFDDVNFYVYYSHLLLYSLCLKNWGGIQIFHGGIKVLIAS